MPHNQLRGTMKSLLIALALGLLTTSLVQAKLPINATLEDAVAEKFYKDGNNTQTALGQAMQQVLGRQISKNDFEVIPLTTQTMSDPWAFAYAHNDKICRAGDNSSEFLILLKIKVKNANASTFATYSFKVTAEQALFATRIDQNVIDNCTEVSETNGAYAFTPPYNIVGDFSYVEIAEPKN